MLLKQQAAVYHLPTIDMVLDYVLNSLDALLISMPASIREGVYLWDEYVMQTKKKAIVLWIKQVHILHVHVIE